MEERPHGKEWEETVHFTTSKDDQENPAQRILLEVYFALKEKGYNPLHQLVGYLLSGEPAYITSHRSARSLIKRVERDELLEELVRNYIHHTEKQADRFHQEKEL